MTFSAIWLGIGWALNYVLKENENEYISLFFWGFMILSLIEILIERKLKKYEELYPVSKAIITYFAMIMIIYVFMQEMMEKPDDIAMLFVRGLAPAMIIYFVHRFIGKNKKNDEQTNINNSTA